jgi:hypothetical protein
MTNILAFAKTNQIFADSGIPRVSLLQRRVGITRLKTSENRSGFRKVSGVRGLPAENDRVRQLLSGQPVSPVNVATVEWTALPNQLQFGKGRKDCEARLLAYRDQRQSDMRIKIGMQKRKRIFDRGRVWLQTKRSQ